MSADRTPKPGYGVEPSPPAMKVPPPPRPQQAPQHRWPEGVSDGLSIPCMRCGEIPAVDHFVDDAFWDDVARPHERKNVLCLECLCRDHEGVADHLKQVQVINGGVTVVLRPIQVVDHATGRSWAVST